MRHLNLKQIFLMFGFFVLSSFCGAKGIHNTDHYSNINIKEASIQGFPKGYAIQATIEGHVLSVVFLENLGQVSVEVVSAMGWEVTTRVTPTPNGVDIYITNTGSYIVYFTLPNGDVYYGEFEVTD